MTDTAPGVTGLDALTPVQRRTLTALRRAESPVVFGEAFVAELRHDAETGLAELGARLAAGADVGDLWVNKHGVAGVLGCEAQHLAPDPFAWTPARARGQVAHRAIQLLVHWRGEPTPIDVVDDALARLVDADTALGEWIAGLAPGEEADLRGQAVERVTKFLECFPPLDKRAHPMTEARAQWPVSGSIQLTGKVDLIIGKPEGRESRKVIIDLKSGRLTHQHREDLRFYALVETLCRDVPPRRLVSFSLDSAVADVEDVTEGLLRSSLRRTLDAIERMIELRAEGRPPRRVPGPTCRWCPLAVDCEHGRSHLAALAD